MFLSFQKITQALRNVSAVVSDVYFNLVTLLVNTTSTNGAQNNTFIDQSVNNFTITRNGVITQGTFTPFSQTGWGNYFDGTNDYIACGTTVANNLQNATGADLTIEGWILPNFLTGASFDINANSPIWGKGDNYAAGIVKADGAICLATFNGSTRTYIAQSSAGAVTANIWSHIAYVFTDNNIKIYVNGTQVSSDTRVAATGATGTVFYIGTCSLSGGSTDWNGYISNFRVANVAVYTTTFTPAITPLTATQSANINGNPSSAITGAQTSLLTCQSNKFVDNSTSPNTLTITGTPSVQAFSPFNSNVAYSTSNVGGSAYLNGSTDYLTWPGNSVTTAFTFECYFYYTGDFSAIAAFCGPGTNTNNALNLYIANSGTLTYDQYGITGTNFTVPTMTANQWYHVAFCRNSSNQATVFLNGTRSTTGNVLITTSFLNIAAIGYVSPAVPRNFTGYLSGVKYSQSALYNVASTTITIPTSPANTANAALCLNFTNAGIFDSAAKNVLRTVGNASVSTAQTKFGTSSMFFDGTGDYVSAAPVNIINAINNANCTIEMWVYSSNSSASLKCLVDTRTGLSNSTGYGIYQIANNVVIFGGGLRGNAVASLTGNTWTHVAVTRANVTNYVFIGGTLYNTFTYGNTLSSGNVTIGADVAGSNAFTGYIDEVRITDGIARYTANFTPTTTAFPTQ